jgi:hypothetical protein
MKKKSPTFVEDLIRGVHRLVLEPLFGGFGEVGGLKNQER